MYTKTTISGIDLHWNYQKHFWFIYIKELLVQKYWQLISTKQMWSVRNIVSSKSRTVQYRVPKCPGPSTEMSKSVPRCPGTEMSSYRDVQVLRCLGFSQAWHRHLFLSMAWEDRLPMHKLSIFPWIETSACGEGCFVWNGNSVSKFHRKKFIHHVSLKTRDRNWEVQAGSPNKIFYKKCLYV